MVIGERICPNVCVNVLDNMLQTYARSTLVVIKDRFVAS